MKSGHQFFIPLESARGIAALIVAAFHVSQTPIIVGRSFPDAIIDPNIEHGIWYPVAYVIRLLTEGGGPTVTGPVLFFYILSGFVLTLSLQSKPDLGMSSSADFLVSRVFRIIPATAFTIAMFCLLYVGTGYHLGPVGSYEPSMLLKNAVLLNASIDGVTWSLQTEMIGSVLVLVTAILYRFCGIGIVVAIGLVLAVMSFWAPWNTALVFFGGPTRIGFIYIFVVGALVFHYGRKLVDALPERLIMPLMIVALVLFFAATKLTSGPSPLTVLLETATAAFVVAALAFHPGSAVAVALSKPVPRFYGRISFSFYLLHPLTLAVIWFMPAQLGAIGDRVPRPLLFLALTFGTALLITPLAYVSYLVAERRGVSAGKSLSSLATTKI